MKNPRKAARVRSRTRKPNRRLTVGDKVPSNSDRALRGASAMISFASVAGAFEDLPSDPETVLCDLLADLMHWSDTHKEGRPQAKPVDFEAALDRARSHYDKERVRGAANARLSR